MILLDIKALQEPTSLKTLFQSMVPETMSVVRGKVLSAQPLRIQVVGDEKMILESNIICLPSHLSTYTTTVDIVIDQPPEDSVTQDGQVPQPLSDTEENEDSENTGKSEEPIGGAAASNITGATMTVYNELQAGEGVYLLSFNEGKKYYVLDREV